MHGRRAGPWARQLQRLGPEAQRRVVRHRQSEAKQSDDGADQPFGLAQRQAEHRPQRQCRGNGQGRVARLPAPGVPWLGLSGRDGRVGEPDGQTATPAQGGIVGRRVRYPMPLLGMWWRRSALTLNGKVSTFGSWWRNSLPHHPTPCSLADRSLQQSRARQDA